MPPPYKPGQFLAWVQPDPEGVRVHRALVRDIEPADATHWRVTTDRGTALVDDAGHAGHVLPIDADIARELWAHDGDWLVRPTYLDHAQDISRTRDISHIRDHSHDSDESLDLDDGYGLD